MPDYLTANVTYKGLEDKGLTVALIDQDKKKWTIWKKDYKDKEADSEPYRALALYKFGETFGVSYGEKEEEFTGKDGKLVKFKRKTIYSIMPPIKRRIKSPFCLIPAFLAAYSVIRSQQSQREHSKMLEVVVLPRQFRIFIPVTSFILISGRLICVIRKLFFVAYF